MDEKEKALDRFVAHEATNYGKTQCLDCEHFIDWACSVMDPQAAGKYTGNREPCPRKTEQK